MCELKSKQDLSVDVEFKCQTELVRGGSAEQHSFEEYLKIVHDRAEFGVEVELEGDVSLVLAYLKCRVRDRVIDVVMNVILADELLFANSRAADVALVGENEGGGKCAYRHARTLVVVSDSGDYLRYLLGVHAHFVEYSEGDYRAAL